ncbi:hypothetical protein [Erwinia sp. Leaf53]|uniref:winged helix-turn-helix domain-containing protein n=1 Tax=Erwinia sp. Leaf53 TaxID=1736225 RepID=UPI0006FA1F50|nr:hypothetical protein [Erwinia sp. Leaf53]KQN54365.1 hypothetical protein ASF13_13125 [Erwinia sp. Leaf53]
MLTHEQCKEIVESGLLKFQDAATLDCRINQLTLHATGQTLALSEPQKRLLVCLFKNITCKRKIINIVWYEYHQRIGDNNYHQLVFQLRTLFKQHRLPAQLVLTVPYYGVRINEPLLPGLQTTAAEDKAEPVPAAALPDAEEPSPALLPLSASTASTVPTASAASAASAASQEAYARPAHSTRPSWLARLKNSGLSCFSLCLLMVV